MTGRSESRRVFMGQLAAIGAASLSSSAQAARVAGLHVSTNEYPWMTFYRRSGKELRASLGAALAEVKASGIDGFEPGVDRVAFLDELVPLLKDSGLEMRSIYVNSTLHDPQSVSSSIEEVLTIAGRARDLAGTSIVVTNPSPIRWGGPENKTDDELKRQAEALDQLGGRLAREGMRLAYHNHDIELRNAAREFHHMLAGTDPARVSFCLDTHWIYRGAGNSSVALFDVIRLYGPRISELHLRQSRDGIWTEAFGEGDLDYAAVAAAIEALGIRPQVTLEQAVETGTPDTMDAATAHRLSTERVRQVFGGLAG